MKITISPFNENLLFVGCFEIAGQETFYRSDNGGASWTFVDYNGLMFANYTIEDIVFSSNYDNVVYLASRGDNIDCNNGIGIYKSTDYGVNWKSKNNGLLNCQMFSIGIESSPLIIGEYIYASNFGNIYKSGDGGESWALKHVVNQGNIKDFEVKGDNIYGAVQDFCPFLFEPLGVIKSTDHGESWSYMRNGILSLTAFAISSEIQNDCIWVGGNYGGFYKSTDYGNSFNENTLRSLKVSTQALIANDNNIIATGSFSTRFNKSTDYGNTWISILNDCGEIFGYDIEADNNFTNLLSTQNGEEGVINGYILKSSNSGLNWYTVLRADDPLAIARFRDIEIDPYNQSTVYMCGNRDYEVSKSTDFGESWETSLQISSLSGFYSLSIDKYSYSGGECKNIYVGGYSCPFNDYYIRRSTNAGISWQPYIDGLPGNAAAVNSLSISEQVSGVYYIYAGTMGGMFRRQLGDPSEYYGWTPINIGIPIEHTGIVSAVAHPILPNVVIAASSLRKIFLSTNYGNSWTEQSVGLPQADIKQLKFSKSLFLLPKLYAATNYGLFEGILQTDHLVFNNINSYNYPNPFNPVTKIYFKINSDSKVEIKIYDILGREIKTILHDFFRKGEHIVEFNGSDLASGLYFYSIVVNGYNYDYRKIVLLK